MTMIQVNLWISFTVLGLDDRKAFVTPPICKSTILVDKDIRNRKIHSLQLRLKEKFYVGNVG